VTVEISPEPSPQEREALLAALARERAMTRTSAWWEAGILDAVEDEERDLGN